MWFVFCDATTLTTFIGMSSRFLLLTYLRLLEERVDVEIQQALHQRLVDDVTQSIHAFA